MMKAAFFDVDGVLKRYTQQDSVMRFEEEAIRGLTLLKERGKLIGYVSGKSSEYLMECAKMSGLYEPGDFFIGENGGVIVRNGTKRRYEKHFEDLLKARRVLENYRISESEFLLRINGSYAPLREEPKETGITLLYDPSTDGEIFRKEIEEYFRDFGLCVLFGRGYVDVTQKGVDKGYAIRKVSKETGIPCEEMLGVGDGYNDIPMLEVVGLPAGPSNSKEEVKELIRRRGGYIAKKPVGEGTLEICKLVIYKR